MKLLLDTHVLIWWEGHEERIPSSILALLRTPGHVILISDLSYWEMILKAQAGKPIIEGSVAGIWRRQQANKLTPLPITIEHILGVESLPSIHKDPFDRLLIAQAIAEGATLVSADGVFRRYPVPVLW